MEQLAPVIDLAARRRLHIARQLQAMGVPNDTITNTRSDAELDDLYTRERTIAALRRLTGHSRTVFQLWDTPELVELEARTVRRLMNPAQPGDDRLIYSMPGRRLPRARRQQRANELRAWGIPA